MTNLTGSGLADFAKSKVGTPYVYGTKGSDGVFTQAKFLTLARMYPTIFDNVYKTKIANKHLIGQVCCDCSGLISWYTGKVLGSAQLYSNAYARLPMNQLSKFATGTVLWKSGHVGVYGGKDSSGRPICIEEKGIDYGCISGPITNPARWTCGLTFNWMNYTIESTVTDITYKSKNPYAAPTVIIRRNSGFSTSVKWIQYELIEAGYGKTFKYNGKVYMNGVKVDGSFGPITEAAVKAFQTSCKITADGEVGPITKQALIANY